MTTATVEGLMELADKYAYFYASRAELEAYARALAAPADSAPVAWRETTPTQSWWDYYEKQPADRGNHSTIQPLYAAPRAPAPTALALTDDQIIDVAYAMSGENRWTSDELPTGFLFDREEAVRFGRAVLAAADGPT